MASVTCCTNSTLDEGKPMGEIIKVAGFNCYQAAKSSSSSETFDSEKLVLILPDIFGHEFINTQVVADAFSKELNCLCVIPDLFDGAACPFSLTKALDMMSGEVPATFFQKAYAIGTFLWYGPAFLMRNPFSKSAVKVETIIKEFRENLGIKKIATSGYCYGGTLAMTVGVKENSFDVICVAHPGAFQFDKVIPTLKAPAAFVMTPDIDFQVKEPECKKIEDLLQVRNTPEGTYSYIFKRYPKMAHGFTTRGNRNVPEISQARDDAFQLAVDFMKKHF